MNQDSVGEQYCKGFHYCLPLAQTENLKALLKVANIDYAFFPAFEIKKISTEVLNKKYDVIIFISANAVNYAEDYFDEIFVEPFKVFAVGPITAQRLIDKDIKVDCFPKSNASSNELLAMQECSELTNKKVLIVRGKGRSEERRVGKECRSRWSP